MKPLESEQRTAFVRSHTELKPVPMAMGIRIYTATELVPIWRATENWLADRGIEIPFWCVPWAGGQALARWLLDHPEAVRGKRVLDFGAGSGLVGIAAAKAGAAHVRAVDVDPLAIAACELNATANAVEIETACVDVVGADPQVDIILAGDVWYELEPSARFASWFAAMAGKRTRILTGDPHRAYAPSNATVLATYDVPTPWELESAETRSSRVLEIRPLPR